MPLRPDLIPSVEHLVAEHLDATPDELLALARDSITDVDQQRWLPLEIDRQRKRARAE